MTTAPSTFVTCTRTYDNYDHQLRVYCPDVGDGTWLVEIVQEYVRLRAALAESLDNVSLDELEGFDVNRLRKILKQRTLPEIRFDNFSTRRSDFGETATLVLLERFFSTRFGYKSIRDREKADMPGRGIDAVGVENTDPVTLVLAEAKVSDDRRTPPGVVDGNQSDSLRNQHRQHIMELDKTKQNLWNLLRFCVEAETKQLFLNAALRFEMEDWPHLKVVSCSVLVRPEALHTDADFGTFRTRPDDYHPAKIRFLVFCVPGDMKSILEQADKVLEQLD